MVDYNRVMNMRSRFVRVLASMLAGLLAAAIPAMSTARTESKPKGNAASVVLFRMEPLGLDSERAARLEALFRLELERMVGAPLLSKGKIERTVGRDRKLRDCTGDVRCLSAIGRLLGVKRIISGNVGELGQSYVINLKLVNTQTGKELRRISEPLQGNPDELIDAVRVAAYRLLNPGKLFGAVAVLSDVQGANIMLDGKNVGKTPLKTPIGKLKLGKHNLRIVAPGYTDFFRDIDVRFQKTTQVEVRMVAATGDKRAFSRPRLVGVRTQQKKGSWVASNWGYVAVGVGAVALGVVVGLVMVNTDVVDCAENPAGCGL